MYKRSLAVALCVASIQPANAAVHELKLVGTVSRITLSYDGVFSEAPTGLFQVGDKLNATARFDTSASELTSLFDADPYTNIYYLPGSNVEISIGAYRTKFTPRFDSSASVQLWNDRDIGYGPTDNQSFEFSNYDFDGQTPFDLGVGLNFEMFGTNAFDFEGSARTSDLIGELVSSSDSFGYNSLFYSYSTGQSPLNGPRPAVIVQFKDVGWTISAAAVPEPNAWLTLLAGFGVMGVTLRRRQRVQHVVSESVTGG